MEHIAGNILFILLFVMVILELIHKKRDMGIVAIGSFILGCVTYIIYILMVIDASESGFDTQSFSMLILAWAFENSAYCLAKKNK